MRNRAGKSKRNLKMKFWKKAKDQRKLSEYEKMLIRREEKLAIKEKQRLISASKK